MSDSRFPILDRIREASPQYGPGQMEVCYKCTEYLRREREIEKQIADELEKHPELLNGNALLHDLMRLRRGER